jgi:hypothetical protein
VVAVCTLLSSPPLPLPTRTHTHIYRHHTGILFYHADHSTSTMLTTPPLSLYLPLPLSLSLSLRTKTQQARTRPKDVLSEGSAQPYAPTSWGTLLAAVGCEEREDASRTPVVVRACHLPLTTTPATLTLTTLACPCLPLKHDALTRPKRFNCTEVGTKPGSDLDCVMDQIIQKVCPPAILRHP